MGRHAATSERPPRRARQSISRYADLVEQHKRTELRGPVGTQSQPPVFHAISMMRLTTLRSPMTLGVKLTLLKWEQESASHGFSTASVASAKAPR